MKRIFLKPIHLGVLVAGGPSREVHDEIPRRHLRLQRHSPWDSDKHEAAWQAMAVKLRGRPMSDEELRTRMFGRTNRAIVEFLCGPVDEGKLAEIVREKEGSYREMMRRDPAGIRLAPGAVELLEYLVSRSIPCALATSSEETNLRFYDEVFNLARWFAAERIVYDDGTFAGKPAPDIYLTAAARLGLAPADCVVFEDAVSGIESARRAGIGRIIAVCPRENHAELRRIEGVYETIADFAEFDREILKVI